MEFFDLLKASKGLPVRDPLAVLWGKQLSTDWPVTEITGSLPLTFESKGGVLSNYRVYGASEGVGDETGNLLNMADLINAPPGVLNTADMDAVLTLTLRPNTTYTLLSTGFGSTDASLDSDIYRSVYFNGPNRGNCVFAGRPRSSISNNDGVIKIGFMKSRTNAQQYINGSAYVCLLEGDHTSTEDDIVPYGYQIPLTVTSGAQSITTPVYIGSTKLGAEEFVDYESGKVWKRRDNLFNAEQIVTDSAQSSVYVRDGWLRYTTGPAAMIININGQIGEEYQFKFYAKNFSTTNSNNIRFVLEYGDGTTVTTVSNSYAASAERHLQFSSDPEKALVRVKSHNTSSRAAGLDISQTLIVKADEMPETYLQPTDPPVPFEAIQTFSGENTLSSTETVGEVSVTGRIKEQEK